MAVKEPNESNESFDSLLENSNTCPKLTTYQEFEIYKMNETIEKMNTKQLKILARFLIGQVFVNQNTVRLLTARLMDATTPVPNFSFEEDMKKRLEMTNA